MLTKILIFIAVLFGVFVVARLGASSATRPVFRRRKKDKKIHEAEDLVRCPSCGAWAARGDRCSCGDAPTP